MTKKDTKLEQPKQEPIVPIEKPVVPSPEQKTEQDVSLEKVKADIAVLKKDNEILQTKQADFEKNKTTLPKEESDKLKQEIETEAKRIEAKKIEILTLIKQTKQELANLKGTVETGNTTTDLDTLEKEVQSIAVEKPSRFGKARETTKTFVSEHKQGLLIGGAVIGGWMLIKSLFKRNKSESSSGEKKEKKGFRDRRYGKALKWGGIATGIGRLGRGLFTGNRDLFGWNPFKKKDTEKPPETTPGSDIIESAKDYEKVEDAKKAPYEELALATNQYYGNAMNDQAGVAGVEDMLGDSAFEKRNGKQLNGLIPYVLGGRYKDINAICNERAFYYEILGAEGHIVRDKFKDRTTDQIRNFFMPVAGMVDSIGGALIKMNASNKVSDFFDSLKEDPRTEEYVRTVFRKSLSVMSYLESRRRKLEHKLAYDYLTTKNEDGFATLDEEKKLDKIIDMLDDEDRYKKNIGPSVEAFMGKNLVEAVAYLKEKNILDGELDPMIQKAVAKVEERKKDLLGIDDDDDESNLQVIKSKLVNGKLSPEGKEKLQKLCEKFEDDIDGFGRKSWYNQYLPILEMFNISEDTLQKMQATGDYDGVVKSYKDYIISILKKSNDGSLTAGDLDGLEGQVNDYYKFQKSLVTTKLNMSEARDKNGNIFAKWTATCMKSGELIIRGIQATIKGELGKGALSIAGGAVSLDLLTGTLLMKRVVGVSPGRLALKGVWHVGKFAVKGGARGIEWMTGRAIRAHLPYGLGARWYSEEQFRHAVCNGELDLEKAIKIANRKKRTIDPQNKNSKIIDSVEDILKRFAPGAKDEAYKEAGTLLSKYKNNPDISKQIFNSVYEDRKLYRPKDRLKLDKTKIKFSLNEGNINKLKAIDTRISGFTNPTEKKIFQAMMKYTKNLDHAENLVTMGIEPQYLKLFEQGKDQVVSAENFGNYLAKYAGKIDANEIKAYQKFLLEAKTAGKMGENSGLFVRNSLKHFAELQKNNFALDQIEKIGLNNSKRTRLAEATKGNTSKMITSLEGMAKNARFKPFWKGLGKQITALNEYKNTITPNGLKAMKDMARLDSMTGFGNLSDEGIKSLTKVSYLLRDVDEGSKLLATLKEAKTVDKVKEALSAKGVAVDNIPKSILEKLSSTKNGKEIERIVNYAAEIKAVKGFEKLIANPAMRYAGRLTGKLLIGLDFAMVGYNFTNQLSEAQQIKQTNMARGERKEDQAYFEVTTGGLGAIAGVCMFIPGAGWIAGGALLGVIAVQEIGKAYYEDIEKFKQNYADFMKKEMPAIKQNLVSINARDQGIDRTLIDKMAAYQNMRFMPGLGLLGAVGASSVNQKAGGVKATTSDAVRALLYFEEVQKYPYATLDLNKPEVRNNEEVKAQVTDAQNKVDEAVKQRFEYIKSTYIDKKKPIIDSAYLQKDKGVEGLDKLLQESSTYQTMMQDESYTEKTNVAGYQVALEKRLKEKNTQAFQKCETLFATKKGDLFLMYAQLPYYQEQAKSCLSEDPEYQNIQSNIGFFKEYITYKMLGKPITDRPKIEFEANKIDYSVIDTFIKSFGLTASTMTAEEIKDKADCLTEEQVALRYHVSPNLGQNILFGIAQKLAYTGPNTLKDLKVFFNEGADKIHGIYCKGDTWYVNEDRGVDNIFAKDTELNSLDAVRDLKKHIEESMKYINTGKMITESTSLNKNYAQQFLDVITEESKYRENPSVYKQKIIAYVTQNSQGKYIQLSPELITMGTKAGIKDIGAFIYAWDGKQFIAKSTIPGKVFTPNNII